MNAWQRLLAASSLAVGTAWELITHPKTGTGATVYVEQVQSSVADDTTTSELQDQTVQAQTTDGIIASTVSVTDAQTNLSDSTITVETS